MEKPSQGVGDQMLHPIGPSNNGQSQFKESILNKIQDYHKILIKPKLKTIVKEIKPLMISI